MRNGMRTLCCFLAIWMLAMPLAALAAEPTTLYLLPNANQTLIVREALQMEATILPVDATQSIRWSSSNPRVASVTTKGLITAKRAGMTTIRAASAVNSAVSRSLTVTVRTAPNPKKITILPADKIAYLGTPLELSATAAPAAASQMVRWASSNKRIATVTRDGIVTPLREGVVRITARSYVRSSVRTVRTLRIVDPKKPKSIEIVDGDTYLAEGEKHTLSAEILPATADKDVLWTTSNASVATVDEVGAVTAHHYGHCTITATTVNNKRKDSVKIIVLNAERTTEVPLRTTSKNATQIKSNLAAIDAVRLSAYNELERLVAVGTITPREQTRRKTALIGAFSMYRFPWITSSRVPYWNSAYKGAKDFLPGRVYYGLPYIQCGTNGNYNNRRYNVAKAVGNRYYTKSGSGYYKMSAKRLSGRYVGNDCSSFVSMATWGMKSAFSFLNTTAMASSSAYKTVSGFAGLRPGDALVVAGSHTVMFLYYTNADKTRMMILEQGGGTSSDMHNTVTCSVVNRSSYSGYKIRRATAF